MANAVTEANQPQAAAQHDTAGSARTLLGEAALLAVRALNGAGAPTLLPAMQTIMNAIPVGAHRSQGSPLRVLDGVAHVQPVVPAPVHGGRPAADGRGVGHVPAEQRPSPAARPEDTLHQERGAIPEPSAGHVPGRSVRTGRGTPPSTSIGRGPPAPAQQTRRTTAPRRPPPPTPLCARRSPESPPGVPSTHRPHDRPAAGPARACPPPCRGQGVPTTEGRSSGKSARAAPCSSSSSRPAGTRRGSLGSPPPTSTGLCPCSAPPSRRPRRGTRCTPSCEHRRSPPLRGSTLCGSPRHRPKTTAGPGP